MEDEKPTKIARRDWIAISIALISIFISVATAYYNLLQERDDVRLVVGNVPTFLVREGSDLLEIDGGLELTVINAGNRPVAMTRADLTISQTNDVPLECTASTERLSVNFEFEPFVLKPGEIKVLNLNNVKLQAPWNQRATGRRAAKFVNLDIEKYILGCFFPELITPDSSRLDLEFPLFKTKVAPVGRSYWYTTRISGPGERPIILFERTGTFLGDWWINTVKNRKQDVLDFSPSKP